jgi:signal peptidase I
MLSWRAHQMRVTAATAVCWLALGFIFTMLLSAVLPLLIGMHPNTVRSGSMSPTIETGDLIVSSQISPTEVEVGDIITFEDPNGGGALITHRVRAITPGPERIEFITRGDANNNGEQWSIERNGTLGRVSYRVPAIGFALVPIAGGMGRILLVVIPGLLLCALGLIRIWRPAELGVAEPLPPVLPVRRLARPPQPHGRSAR